MCTNETRQETVFLLALRESRRPMATLELARKMTSVTESIGWPVFLVRSPRSIEALTERASFFGHIEKVSANKWRITNLGRKRLEFFQLLELTDSVYFCTQDLSGTDRLPASCITPEGTFELEKSQSRPDFHTQISFAQRHYFIKPHCGTPRLQVFFKLFDCQF